MNNTIASINAVLLLAVIGCSPGPKAASSLVWTPKSGEPIPRGFCFVLFPVSEKVEMTKAGGVVTGKYLNRAILCNEKEVDQATPVSIWEGSDEYFVERSNLTPRPDRRDLKELIAGLNRAIASWGTDTDWSRVEVKIASVSSVKWRVVVAVNSKSDDLVESHYAVDHDVVTPLEMYMAPRF